jgi:AP-4 complex subunit epsilon-1
MATGGINLSKEFFELLKAIGESKSKQEEDRIIAREVSTLKSKLEHAGPQQPSKKRAKEFLVRLLYIEMLGHDASFGYIKAVELAASASLYHKRTGYLVCGACLSPDHEFRFMLVNQMQRDLQSSNILEICGGLLAATSLITSDMVPAMSTAVGELLSHDAETVRKKAIICLHRFHQLSPDTVTSEELVAKIRKVLCDRDPAVMGSSLNVIEAMCVSNTQQFKDLIPSLVSILKQIGEHRLPTEFDYHRVPAPWMQIRLVRILSLLGQADADASSGMYEILMDTMKKADVGINAGYAIVYECIKCLTKIYPNPQLLDAAADAISRFIQSKSHNLKYLGVTGLAMIVETHPQYAAQHQLAVMDCLEDPDETLQRKTLDLLYRMTNPVNVEFITEKLLDFLRGTTDLFLKQQLTTRVCSVAERYAPNNAWYIQTITQLFEISGDMVAPQVANNLMSLIAEGTGESEEEDMLLRQNAVELYVQLLQDKPPAKLPKILLETMAWCLGEYAYLSAVCNLNQVLSKLCAWDQARLASSTRKCLTSAIFKLVAQAGVCPPQAAAVIDQYTRSKDVDLQQRCLEFQALLTTAPEYLGDLFPVDASAEDVDVDVNLAFLDGFVGDALANGARPYDKPQEDDDDEDDDYGMVQASTAFKMTPYAKPEQPGAHVRIGAAMGPGGQQQNNTYSSGVTLPPGGGGSNNQNQAHHGGMPGPPPPSDGLALNTRGVNVWGKKPTAPAPAAAAPAPGDNQASSSNSNPYGQQHQQQQQQQDAYGGSPSRGGFGSQSASYGASSFGQQQPPPPVEKTKEQLEKERQAAALFGGMVPGAPPPPPRASPPRPPAAPAAPAPPPPPQAPAVEIDLLDMMGFDDVAPMAPAANGAVDIFSDAPAPVAQAPAPAAPPPVVETVSDDQDDVSVVTTNLAAAAPAAAAPMMAEPVDPFAAEGLLSDLTDAPLKSFMSNSNTQIFEYNGSPMGPLTISTAQFGQQWGSCHATSPASVTTGKISTLDMFMKECVKVGLHPIEAIAATNEGICAGMVNAGAIVILVHGKVSPLGGGQTKLDLTVKSTDPGVTGSLALYMQNMMN